MFTSEIEVHTGKILQASRNHGDLVLSFIVNCLQATKGIVQRTNKIYTDGLLFELLHTIIPLYIINVLYRC